jgi:murein DD-endopeptidase MepM/ murein hydrolase activator NlpD
MYEIQFHPAGADGKVRHLYLSRRTYRWLVGAAAALGLTVVVGSLVAPLGIQSLLLSSDLRVLRQQNRLQRAILAQRERSLEELEGQLALARTRQKQISLILGAPLEAAGRAAANGQGASELSVAEAQLALYRSLRLGAEGAVLLERADRLARFAGERSELTRLVPSICPLPASSFVLTSPFGERVSPFTGEPEFHAGVDLAAREGTPVWATGEARVLFAGKLPLRGELGWWLYGNLVVLDHGGRYLTVYGHLAEIRARRGASVARGDTVGTVGSSGWSTTPHLHYEVRVVEPGQPAPVPVDPRAYILDYRWQGAEAFSLDRIEAPPGRFDPLPFK